MSSILVNALGSTLVFAGMLYKKRFDRDAGRAPAINEATLLDILRINQRTEYGERHGFSRIRSAADYRRAVPLATYEHFRDSIERIAAGEQNLLTADRIAHLGLTSGTTGVQKMIPITARAKRIIAQNMMLFTQGVLAETVPASRRGGRGMILLSSVVPTRTPGGLLAGPGTSIGMKSMTRISSLFWSSPPEVYEVKSQGDAHYLHLLFALAERDLQYISAPFASGVLDLFHALESHASALLHDLAEGTIRQDLALEPAMRRALLARLRPDSARARELERIFARGFEAVAPRAFPAMSHITAVTSAGFGVYAERLKRYIGDLPVYSAVYGSTEAVLGVGLGPGRPRYVIPPRTAFFEFIPESAMDEDNPRTLLYGELSPGERYEIVVTSYTGLYRYRMGDVVEVLAHHRRAPVIDFLHRRGGLLNLVGEKTSEQAAREALAAALAREGHELVDFSTMADMESTPERYVFFLELRRPLDAEARGRLEALLEDALCGVNPVYDASRSSGKLAPASLRLVRAGTFRELRDQLIARGASPSQVKIPRVVRDDTSARLLFDRTLLAEGTAEPPSFVA